VPVTPIHVSTLKTLVYLSTKQPAQPELSMDRYSPSSHPIGICFSGGGPRAMSAGMGQVRGFLNSALWPHVGAISCVSGGSWFGSIFSYADGSIDDEALLGPMTAPADITLDNAATVPATRLTYGLTQINNEQIARALAIELAHCVPSNRLYARMLNRLLLTPFRIDDVNRFFALGSADVDAIIANNPSLTPQDFYTLRDNRPYFIAQATQVYPVTSQLEMRQFEYSPLYAGTPQLFPTGGSPKGPFGGGYVQNFAFDSSAPQAPDSQGRITVDAPLHRFTISDLMGSSGAAPGSVLDMYGFPSLFDEFHYWAPGSAGAVPDPTVQKMSIVDGGDLENTGIVALLRRQYPVIVVCVNTSTPMNFAKGTYEGIDYQIASLFGYKPSDTQATREIRQPVRQHGKQQTATDPISVPAGSEIPNAFKIHIPQQPIQVFPQDDFQAVHDGLAAALEGGGPVYAVTEHLIYENNPFGIAPYPDSVNGGKVKVVWLYNQRIRNWVSQLQPDVAAFLDSKEKTEFMANFPNYDTVQQNSDRIGIKELLMLTPRQVNLLADMWSWAVQEIAEDIRKLV